MVRENLLEKALNRFERTDLNGITIVAKPYPEPDEYLIRFGEFKLVLAHQDHLNGGQQSLEEYSLRFVYVHGDEKAKEFIEEAGNFGRIKEIYDSIKNKIDKSYKMQVELNQRESEEKSRELQRKLEELEKKL